MLGFLGITIKKQLLSTSSEVASEFNFITKYFRATFTENRFLMDLQLVA